MLTLWLAQQGNFGEAVFRGATADTVYPVLDCGFAIDADVEVGIVFAALAFAASASLYDIVVDGLKGKAYIQTLFDELTNMRLQLTPDQRRKGLP